MVLRQCWPWEECVWELAVEEKQRSCLHWRGGISSATVPQLAVSAGAPPPVFLDPGPCSCAAAWQSLSHHSPASFQMEAWSWWPTEMGSNASCGPQFSLFSPASQSSFLSSLCPTHFRPNTRHSNINHKQINLTNSHNCIMSISYNEALFSIISGGSIFYLELWWYN